MDKPASFLPTMSAFFDPETYRDILDGLQIGVRVLDLQKKIVFWSDDAEQITGYARIDVLGHSCTDNILQHCNQISCEMCAGKCPMATALNDARPVEAMSFIHHKSGQRTPVHTWAIPLRDKYGSCIGLIQTFEGEFVVGGPDPHNRSLKERGRLDDLTGLPNQAMMQSHLREMLGTLAELHIPFAIVCVELHDLSQFRARYGQEAATSMLLVLARTLSNTAWPADFVGRWSVSQFLVILSGCPQDALQAVSQRILNLVSSATIQWWGEELSIGILLGCTAAMPGDTVESLLQRAQPALTGNQLSLPVRAIAMRGADPSGKS
jgi:diguanylate cyclase (GGDEF)-like protein/PAS domain S-box-containing protein